ncbi:hypothetical protein SAMD00019534_000160 [Acytostelium subglobosum LB1]|uniref:hypothetical protein n=1 Tax=Acytostelium subglobosum LB1 TaxID=1410327 RepID=UPI000644E9F1|nr:hypothetical protein SAMD00019534_000160 [Acytostelium subglobosum LB1]GAM16841.1 hypothetical protein SAMD00019534_000160 [Acytostelium subglobosum LB1]|eukprot:XP_012758903.1 hypothetical protein SAMD00019534_000160 [Acytostelium subglobosum LB1]
MEVTKYQSFIHGFSIDYPKGWKVSENMGFSAVIFTPPIHSQQSQESTMLNLNVSIQDLSNATNGNGIPSPDDFLNISIQQVSQMGARALKHGPTKIGPAHAQYDGYFMSYMLENEGSGIVKINQSFFINNTFTYVVTLSVPSREPSLIEAYEKAVASFTIFAPKGLKTVMLSADSNDVDIVGNSMRYSLFTPNNWINTNSSSSNSNNGRTSYSYKAPIGDIKLDHSVEVLANQSTAKAYCSKAENTLRMRSTKDSFVDRSITLGKLLTMPAVGGEAKRFIFTRAQREYQVAIVVIGDCAFTTTLETTSGDMEYFNNLFDAIVSSFRVNEIGAKDAEGGALEYKVFAHLIKSFVVNVPLSFKMSDKLSTNDAVLFYVKDPEMPVFSMTFEDMGSIVAQEDYKQLILQFHNESMQGAKIVADRPSRLDHYKASTVEMMGFDPQMGNHRRVVFKCSVVRRRFGVLLSLSTNKTEFEGVYNSSFFVFDSFKLI